MTNSATIDIVMLVKEVNALVQYTRSTVSQPAAVTSRDSSDSSQLVGSEMPVTD
jgi:hypothetical protein